jgi:hypothetical protein
MPRDVAYTDHLEEVERDLARRAGDRTAYDTFLGLPAATLVQLAGDLYDTFWRVRAVTSLWTLVQGYRSHLSDPPVGGVALPGAAVAGDLLGIATTVGVQWLPDRTAIPADLWSAIATGGPWRFGGAPSERIALRIADWLSAARERMPLGDAVPRGALRACQTRVHEAIRDYRTVARERERAEAQDIAANSPLTQEQLVRRCSATWTVPRQNAGRDLLVAVATELVAARAIAGLPSDVLAILGVDEGTAPSSSPLAIAQGLLMADVAWRGARGELDDEHQSSNRYEFLRINAAAPAPFQSPPDGYLEQRADGAPGSKLFGMQLGHFAGFVRAGWRANDFMWGRLDGAAGLVELVLAPRRLKLSPVRYDDLVKIPGLRTPHPVKRLEYLDPDNGAELEEWRACLQDTLALAIVESELQVVAEKLATDTSEHRFADGPDLATALGATDPRTRFLAYAEALSGGASTPARTIKVRVQAEDDSFGGKQLEEHAGQVVGEVLEGQGGPQGQAGKVLMLFGVRRIRMDAKALAWLKGAWGAVRRRV